MTDVLSQIAEKTFVINLAHRTDRLESVRKELAAIGHKSYEVLNAYGINNPPPRRYYENIPDFEISGWYGNKFSHYSIIEQAKKDNLESVMVFEDDVVLHKQFSEIVSKTVSQFGIIEWDWLQFGGNHSHFYTGEDAEFMEYGKALCPVRVALNIPRQPIDMIVETPVSPIDGKPYIYVDEGLVQITPNICRILKMFTAHAYLVKSAVYDFILDNAIKSALSIDGFYAHEVHPRFKCYCVTPCVATQAPGINDISNCYSDYREYIGD